MGVVGIASHDALYSPVSVDVDMTSSRSTEETPYSLSPFERTNIVKKHSPAIHVEDLTDDKVDHLLMKPLLGGHNQTRQNREDAKLKRNQQNATSSMPTGPVKDTLNKADACILDQQYDRAVGMLLDLVETDMDLIKGCEKLAVHEKISHAASLLGWL